MSAQFCESNSVKTPPSVLAVGYPDLYGAGRAFLASVVALKRMGHEVFVVVPETGPLLPHLREAGISYKILEFPVLRKSDLRPRGLVRLVAGVPRSLWSIRAQIRSSKPNLVLANGVPFWIWLVGSRLAATKSVCRLHEAEDAMLPLLAKSLVWPLRFADLILANSHHTEKWLTGLNSTLKSKTRVIYNGFSFPESSEVTQEFGNPVRLVHIGRINDRKGQDVAIRATKILLSMGCEVELRIVGSVFRGYENVRESLIRLVDDLNLQDQVTFVGEVGDTENEYRLADIAIMPSLVESFGNVAVEALGFGKPVVASDVGGLREILGDGERGMLCSPGDPQSLADQIAQLIHEPMLASRLADAGGTYVRKTFGQQRFEEDLSKVFTDLVTPCRRAPLGMVVCIVGPDGTGKSTLAGLLPTLLGERRIQHRHWRPGVLPSLRSLAGKGEGGTVTDPHGRGVNSWPKATFRSLYYWMDFLLGHWFVDRNLVRDGVVVIVERGWQDMLVDPRRYLLANNHLLRILSPFVPRPDITLVLDLDPALVHKRKTELTLQELKRQRDLWPHLARSKRQTVILDASLDSKDVAEEAASVIAIASRL